MSCRHRRPPLAAGLFAGAAALLLAACATRAPSVEKHAGIEVAQAWHAQAVSAPADDNNDGWLSFNDGLLDGLIAQAWDHNTSIARARANLTEARALRNQAASGLLPSVSAAAGMQRSQGGSSPSRLATASLDASWEADLFGAAQHAVAAQDALARASDATLQSTRVSIAAEVALAYLDLRSAQARAGIARDNLRSQEETLQIARWREQAGLASSLEVEQASTSVEQTRAQLPVLEAGAATSIHAIAALAGRPLQALFSELGPDAPLPQPPDTAVAPPAQTLGRRPDVLAAQEKLRAAAEQVAQADANRYPQLQLTASAQWSGLTLGSLGSIAAARALAASIAAPVFDAGLRSAQLAQRRAAFEAATQDYRAAVLGAIQEVENALVAIAASRARLAALRAAFDSARNADTLAGQRYRTGVIDFLTVLETQRTLLGVQDSVAAAQAELAQNQVRLYKALGGGWHPGAQGGAS